MTLSLKYSSIQDSLGGDILLEEESYSIPEIVVFVNSEDAFFSKTVYMGLYIQNKGTTVKRNIDVTLDGGETTRILSDNYLDIIKNTESFPEDVPMYPPFSDEVEGENLAASRDIYPLINREFYESDDNFDHIGEYFWNRFRGNFPPFYPNYDELSSSSDLVSEPGQDPFYLQYKDWFFRSILMTSSTRGSVFGQLVPYTLVNDVSILNVVNDEGIGVGIDLSKASFEYGGYQKQIPDLSPGSYWGFWIKIEVNFDPGKELDSDFCFLRFSWEETDGDEVIIRSSRYTKVKIIANYRKLVAMHKNRVTNFYLNYPNYFIHHEDIDE